MIRDSICDEVANIKRCLYDGGDCCLDVTEKETEFCNICTCKLDVDEEMLAESFQQLDVKQFDKADDFDVLVSKSLGIKTYEDVSTEEVCTTICLDPELVDQVNGWKYDFQSKECICGWMQPTEWNVDVKLDDITGDENFETPSANAYIQHARTLNSSKNICKSKQNSN